MHPTRQKLLDQAKTLLMTEGLDGLRMDKVAREAGVSKGALMHHFPSREALLEALALAYSEYLYSRQAQFMKPYTDLPPYRALLLGMFDWVEAFYAEGGQQAQWGVLMLSLSSHNPRLLSCVKAWYGQLMGIINTAPESVRPAAMGYLMMMEGLFYVHKFGFDNFSAESLKAMVAVARKEVERWGPKRSTL